MPRFKSHTSFFALLVQLAVVACQANKPPEIPLILAIPGTTEQGDTVVLRALASDPERGRLNYRWQTNGGKFSTIHDSLAVWQAPNVPGRYRIWVTVTDAFGARASRRTTIKVLDSLGSYADFRPAKGTRIRSASRRPGGRQTQPLIDSTPR